MLHIITDTHGRDEDMTKVMRQFKKTPAVANCEAILLDLS